MSYQTSNCPDIYGSVQNGVPGSGRASLMQYLQEN